MDIFKLLFSMIRRLVTAISTPFRMLMVRAQRLLNVNVISAKLIQPLTKNVKKLFRLRPKEKADYVKIGRFLVFKQLFRLLVVAICAAVFIYFQMYAEQVEAAPDILTGIKTDVTFRYDDISIREFSGIANIKSYDGRIVYTGEIERGVCAGSGALYSREGYLLYEGGFSGNRYSGFGVKYTAEGKVEYEGEFADNLYHGAGKLYNAAGNKLYEGQFKNGLYDGPGKLFGEAGGSLYEGDFSGGKCHGQGTEYYADGMVHYKGQFFEGAYQGTGELYGKSGQLLYTGAMHGGAINYRSLVGATLAEVEAAFAETPAVYYQEDGSSCFFYEKAGVILTADCRIKVYEREIERENPSEGFYYMPGDQGGGSPPTEGSEVVESRTPAVSEGSEAVESPTPIVVESSPTGVPGGWEAVAPTSLRFSALPRTPNSSLTLVPMAWEAVDPNAPAYPDSSSSSGSSDPSQSQPVPLPSQPDSSSQPETPSFQPDTSSQPDTPSFSSPSNPSVNAQGEAGQVEENGGAGLLRRDSTNEYYPEFIEKVRDLYYEIDRDVWQSEKELDKTKVLIRRVTVIGGAARPEDDALRIDDNTPPGVEDCVAIDHIRKGAPTAFGEILYEIDNQNKLFQRVWNISHAGRILRDAYIVNDLTYTFCYGSDQGGPVAYYSIER